MLETVDTSKRVDREAYAEWFPRLKNDLRELQLKVREANVPVAVLFEGWPYSGKADSIRQLTDSLDPRGFAVHTVDLPSKEERQRHWLWRYWIRTPARGKFALFEKSWYTRVLDERIEGLCTEHEWQHAFQEINHTEEMLSLDGTIVVKFWLHISREEQKKRFSQNATDPFRRLDKKHFYWQPHKKYAEILPCVEEMLERTSTHFSPWIVVEAEDHRYRRMKVLQALCEAIANGINRVHAKRHTAKQAPAAVSVPVLSEMPTVLDSVDLKKTLAQDVYDEAKKRLQARLLQLQFEMVQEGVSLLCVYEGWDAAGKGGSIRRLTANLDPRFYDVVPIGKPSPEELAHHYLWRFWREIPKKGYVTIFDRSYYGRVMVERIEGFCREDEWRRAYQEINEFELSLFRSGTQVVKFWLHISDDEQLARFEARKKDVHKRHKLTEEDWRNRDKWDAYREAVDEMIKRTSTTYAPWTIVEGNCKRYARVRTMETMCKAMEEALARRRAEKKKG